MLRDDARFLKLKMKSALEEKDELVEQMAKLQIKQEADLDLRPLAAIQLSSFAAVAEFIQADGTIDKDEALQKVCNSFDQYSKFIKIHQFFEKSAPEFEGMLQSIRLKICSKFKILILNDLNETIFYRRNKRD